MEKDTVKMSSHFFMSLLLWGGGGVKWTADEVEDFSSSFFPSRVCVCVFHSNTHTNTSVRTIFFFFF